MTAALGERISNLIRLRGSEAIKQLKELITSNDFQRFCSCPDFDGWNQKFSAESMCEYMH